MPAATLPDLEQRYIPGELRVDTSSDRKIRGYAIVFNAKSEDLGGFREVIFPEAVTRTLREGLDVRALVDHDSAKVIGRMQAGTLRMEADSKGLRVEITPPKTTDAKNIVELIQTGNVTGMSFAFRTIEDNWRYEDGEPLREVIDMRIREVSIVSFPAYPQTDVALRSLAGFRQMSGVSQLDFLHRKVKLGAR